MFEIIGFCKLYPITRFCCDFCRLYPITRFCYGKARENFAPPSDTNISYPFVQKNFVFCACLSRVESRPLVAITVGACLPTVTTRKCCSHFDYGRPWLQRAFLRCKGPLNPKQLSGFNHPNLCNWVSRTHISIQQYDITWNSLYDAASQVKFNASKMKQIRRWRIEILPAEDFGPPKIMVGGPPYPW